MQSLQNRFALGGDKVAFQGIESSYTYFNLYKLSLKLNLSIKEGCLILVLIENNVQLLGLYAALLALKRPMILASPTIDNESLKHLINKYKPRYVVANKDNLDRLSWGFKVDDVDEHIFFSIFNDYSIIDKNVSLLVGTSGGSSKSKYCILSHKNVVWSAIQIKKSLGINSSHIVITTLPPSYIYGLSIINSHIFSSATIVVTSISILNKLFWDIVLRNEVTTLNFVPVQLNMLQRFTDKFLLCNTIKNVTQAGGPLSKDIALYWSDIFKSNNINFYMMYGQTEASSRMSVAKVEEQNIIGTVGRGIVGGELLVKSTSITNPSELIYIGRNVFCGYAQSFSDLKNIKELNLLNTGDLGYSDLKGNIYIVGRNSRIIKINSIRYSLDDIESYLNDSSYKVFCTGIDNQLIVHHSSSIDGLANLIGRKFNIASTLIKFNFIKDLPFNENGKPNYAQLKNS